MSATRLPNERAATIFAILFAVAIVAHCFPSALTLAWAQDSAPGGRKVVSRVEPQYPNIARAMNIRGSVRLDALVAPNGSVKSVEVKGGHPTLAQAALDAVRHWKWEPAAHETHELIEVRFNAN